MKVWGFSFLEYLVRQTLNNHVAVCLAAPPYSTTEPSFWGIEVFESVEQSPPTGILRHYIYISGNTSLQLSHFPGDLNRPPPDVSMGLSPMRQSLAYLPMTLKAQAISLQIRPFQSSAQATQIDIQACNVPDFFPTVSFSLSSRVVALIGEVRQLMET
ncbi:hypothetical protein JB92DRAFT_2836293 [Gautieria morchelliformis]|nr:hypothetical protein JB92DRAFT_2836293 [Gautieria morchelliformis]